VTGNRVLVRTSEGVSFSLRLAGPVSRFLAWLIDAAAIGALTAGISTIFKIAGAISPDLVRALAILAFFAISIGYAIALEWLWRGQTLGKRVLHLRVLDANAQKLQFPQIAIRNLMRFLDALPFLYLAGGLSVILSRRSQRLGDVVANTIVIKQEQFSAPILAVAAAEKYNSFLEFPHLAARLRHQTPPELAQIAYEALLRRNDLDPAVRLGVFRELADRFRQIVKFPTEVTAALTDERYVRNALQIATTRERFRTPASAAHDRARKFSATS
jgi:uncharacterized RDD family membrane protein YckC